MKTKENILAALHRFISQRSGMDYANYGERKSFMSDYRPMLQAGKDARAMARRVELSAITADDLLAAAGNGRLQFAERGGALSVDYTVGQYFPTEYRAAACRLLASVLWRHYAEGTSADSVRKWARNNLGRGMAKRWFN
jgi:hypothetical protein